MNFNKHFNLEGRHAFLGASRWHWINYDDNKLATSYRNFQATAKGTELHDFAAQCIKLGQKLPRSKKTLNAYVNDAIGFRMTPEQVLYYSDNCFGTADAIYYGPSPADRHRMLLRIHDLKTGVTPAHMEQLLIYAAMFCLEYRVNPEDIDIELRIYQLDEVPTHEPSGEEVRVVMDQIVSSDKVIAKLKQEGRLS